MVRLLSTAFALTMAINVASSGHLQRWEAGGALTRLMEAALAASGHVATAPPIRS